MSATIKSHAGRVFGRVTQVWAELDHAQRRLLEIRTGVPQLTRQEPPAIGASLDELEALYALEQGQAPTPGPARGLHRQSRGDSAP